MNLAALSIKRPIFISCVVALMLILGVICLKKMPVDLFPDVTFPIVGIQVTYPGASPIDLEKQVSKLIEDELGSLSGLKTITSNNLDSIAMIILEFRLGTDVKEAEQQVRNRLGNIRRNLPNDIYEPVIFRFDPADQPVITLAITSKLPPGEAYDVANEMIKPQFERLNDIGKVDVVGGRKTEIQVLVDKNKVQDRQISMVQIARRIEETSKDIPIGKVENPLKELLMRTSGEFSSLDEIRNVNVNFMGSDRAVLLSDVGHVERGLEDQKSMARIKGSPALLLQVYKQSGSNTVAVTDAVKKSLEKVNTFLGEKKIDAKVQVVRDMSRPIRLNVADVNESIMIGIFLCVIVVFFFLGSGRSTFITGMALPNSLLGGFIVMYAMGFSINMMTLLALSLAVGLLIDDAIVVRENIFRHMEMGKDPKKAALDGTMEVAQAVVATTLVVIAVFGPISFLQGIIGQFFKQFGLTIVFTMLISLFDAFTVAPMLSAYMASPVEHDKKRKGFIARMLGAFDRFQTGLENLYEALLHKTLRFPKSVLLMGFLIFVGSMATVPFIPKTFLPSPDNGEFTITIEMPVGTSLQGTGDFTKDIEDILNKDKSVEMVLATIGSMNGEANKANLFVRLVERKHRSMTTTQMKTEVRKQLEPFKQKAVVEVGDVDAVNSGQKPFNLNVTGDDLESLSKYANALKERLQKIDGLVDVDTDFRSGKPEFHVVFDRKKSEHLGVSTVLAGAELRNRTEGAEAAVFREKGIEYKVRVRFEEKYRDLREQFNTTFVPNSNNNMIPLSRIAAPEDALGYSQINRQNKSRFINVAANIGPTGSLGTITEEIQKIVKDELPPPPGVDYRFQGQAEDFQDLISSMLLAIFLGVLFIYLVLSSLYESFVTPFTILLALPLAMCGAMVALLVFGKTIDIFSLIGIVLLLGVVAKNSILLVDYTKQLEEAGLTRNAALLKACRTRLRPILMTSLALIAGMVPIAIGLNEASAMRTSMGIAIIGGLVSSTVLTLLIVPAAYGFVDDFRMWMGRILSRFGGGHHAPAEAAKAEPKREINI